MRKNRTTRARFKALRRAAPVLALLALLFVAAPAIAQDGHGPPSPEEMKEKVKEIERLMKQAEKALARSTDTRGSAETSAETARRLEKLLDEKARASTGQSADELRKAAEEGSASASEALKKLMEQAKSESSSASEGVRKLLEETRKSGQGAREGIQWILENATSQGQGGGGGGGGGGKGKPPPGEKDPKKQEGGKKPEDQQESEKPPDPNAEHSDSNTEPPSSPEKERWLAELPPQVRRAYETQDWDSIPPKWRDILRAWTRKMADKLEKGRK